VDVLRRAGATDGEILEANQVVSYFNYANRVLNGLGVTTEGDVLGNSPRTRK
jgi:alkylhydroperoxidase family enzyme